ncbi:MAG: PEP-CTERM sorting domain-containing protein [Phycisphaerae bacterium]
MRRIAGCVMAGALCLGAGAAWAEPPTVTVEATMSAWYQKRFSTYTGPSTNQNYVVGFEGGTGDKTYRNLLVFDLSGVVEQAVSAEVRLTRGTGRGTAEAATYTLHEVTTPLAMAMGGGTSAENAATFADLGSGVVYGSAAIPSWAEVTDIVTIELNDDALAGINAAGGLFALGGALSPENTSGGVRFGHTHPGSTPLGDVLPTRYLVLTIPEPATLSLLALGGLAVVRRRRR